MLISKYIGAMPPTGEVPQNSPSGLPPMPVTNAITAKVGAASS